MSAGDEEQEEHLRQLLRQPLWVEPLVLEAAGLRQPSSLLLRSAALLVQPRQPEVGYEAVGE